ncbi:MAG: glycosyltransferase family 2 protein [Candidatus Pacearchaeota archaeon]
MNISIIIPNYNGEELLRINLPKIIDAAESYKKGSVELIIVDDCSTDSSVPLISSFKSKISNFKFLKNEKNLGFAPTVNRAVRQAIGDILVLLNTDVAPEKSFLDPLVKNFKNKDVFAVGCMDKSIENGRIVLRGRGIGKWEKGFLIHKRGEIDKINTLWVSGGSGAFRKSIWERLSGFDELYAPFYWEDIDLSYRAIKSGYEVLFEPRSIVVHEHEKGAIKSRYSNFQVKTIAYRNQFIFVWKNATDFDLQVSHLFWLPYHFFKAILRFDIPFFLGFFKALILFPKIIKSSFKSQKLFIRSDKEAIGKFI